MRFPMRLSWAAVAALALACGSKSGNAPAPTVSPGPSPSPSPSPTVGTAAALAPAAPAVPPPPAAPVPPPPAAPVPPPQPTAPDGADFTAEARALYRIVACGSDEPLADPAIARVVERHCRWVGDRLAKYRATYLVGGRAFFDGLKPAGLPTTVVYPFGGGDLISALAAFPEATEVTTVSLELAGDPRRITGLTAKQLDASLARLRGELGGTLSVGSNTSVNLSASQRNELPAQVSSFLLGLAAAGFEPVGMRYVRPLADGQLHGVTADEIAAEDAAAAARRGGERGQRTRSRKHDWLDPNFSESFAHVEIRYRAIGEPTAPIRVHRHFGWNLHDSELAKHPELIRHLETKGKVIALVKGASYLLWRGDFATIRDYLLGHLAWMLSDSTGVPPFYARAAGMVQETYGRFSSAFLEGAEARGGRHAADFRALWKAQPRRPLPFRFGYVDGAGQAHVVVTRPGP
jgi:hypothetical protein